MAKGGSNSDNAPDGVFLRSIARLAIICFAMLVVAHLALSNFLTSQHAEARLLWQAKTDSDQLAELVSSVALAASTTDAAARKTLIGNVRDTLSGLVDRFEARDAQSASMSAPARKALSSTRLTSTMKEALAALPSGELSASEAIAVKSDFASRITPYKVAFDNNVDTALANSAARMRFAIPIAGLACLFGFALIGATIFLPALRRIKNWVLRTRQADEENRFRLLHDPLTGMPNGTYLRAFLERLAASADRRESGTAIIRVDLDKFGVLHDTLGPKTGEEIIRIVARRIQKSLRAGDFAAHLGNDDFVVVAADLEDTAAAVTIAQRLQSILANPFSVRGGAHRLGACLGVTLLSDDAGAEADRILFNAERALLEAQTAGGGRISYFRDDLRREIEARETLYTELLRGLENGELAPYFQPQIDLQSGRISGFEALVRWEHPSRGVLAPGAFLDLADETDLTERIGEMVLSRSLGAINAWDAAGFDIPRVGVNFALAQLRNPRLIEKIKWEVERFDVDPSRIAIEVLETVLIKSDADLVVRNIRGLASAGFHIELDDFGTGHASISNLRRFMVNQIKIDRCFVMDIETNKEQQQLTASMIAMAEALGIGTLAEGVESEAAESCLRDLGCNHFQGFLVAKPMSVAETFKWIRGFPGRDYAAASRNFAGDPNTP